MATERTVAFFAQNVEVLAEQLRGREIIASDSGHRILITSLEPWLKQIREGSTLKVVGTRYKAMEQMDRGDLWAPVVRRGVRQSLVVAQDNGIIGACVRLLGARSYNPTTGEFNLMPREGDIANFLGLTAYEKAKFVFIDDSEVLHLIRGQVFKGRVEKSSDVSIAPDQANSQLKRLLE